MKGDVLECDTTGDVSGLETIRRSRVNWWTRKPSDPSIGSTNAVKIDTYTLSIVARILAAAPRAWTIA